DFELAVRNMADVVRRKNEAGAKKPFVEWQYIVTRHNEHQIDDAKAMGKELGVDLVRFIPVRLIVDYDEDEKKAMAEEWFPTNPAYRKFCFENFNGQASYLHKENCFHLYRSLAINPDGGVHPCNIIYHPGDDFGNILNSGFKEIWNNDQYRAARSLFNPDKVDNKVETPCSNCRIFRR
ncbi:MAG: SPASM domain-containing protein, partial [Terriglobia bacterium]